jgi:hypothetical protein
MSTRQVIHAAFLEMFRRFTSRKLFILIVTCTVPWLCLERAVYHMKQLQSVQAGVYGGMFAAVLALIGVAISKYLGIPTSYSATGSFTGALSSVVEAIHEKREEKIESIEHVVDEGAPGAPARKPFAITPDE